MQDIELIEELQSNPEVGLGHLMDQYTGLVLSIIKGKLLTVGTQDDIRECASDVFMEFYQHLEYMDPGRGSVKAYLAIIAKHKAVDLYRKLVSMAARITETDQEWEELEDGKAGPEQEVIERELKEILLRAIDQLGEPDREIFIRKYYLGQRTKEIAEQMNLRENTVDKKISRGLKKLRIMLGGMDCEREDSILAK